MLNDITTTGGMSIDRTHRPKDGSAVGGYLISGLVRNVNKRNIEVMLDTSVSDIIFENGEVTGVRLTTEENETVIVATKSVIVATGGFSANSQMVVKYRPDWKDSSPPTIKGPPAAVSHCWSALGRAPWIWAKFRFTPPWSRKPRT